jgi:hypothetical protein
MLTREQFKPFENLTVSQGTMRLQDIIPAFVYALENLEKAAGETRFVMLCEESRLADFGHDFDSEAACELADELFQAINTLVPEGWFFGSHPGDGADFGFWEDNT